MPTKFLKFLRTFAAPALIAGSMIGVSQTALAQSTPPLRVRGAITAVAHDAIKVHTTRGEDLKVKLHQDTKVRAITLAKISDIKPGSYIGTAATTRPDGSLQALEVHVFPPAMAGTGDGHRPWDLGANSSMTNGVVGDLLTSDGRTLTLKYKGGEKKIVVPEDVPIVNIEDGDRSLLKVGTRVVLFGTQATDGSFSARSISAGKDGVTPPM